MRAIKSAEVFRRRRRRNGSGILPGDIRREMVRNEPRVVHHILPGHDEKVSKGESVDIRLTKDRKRNAFFSSTLR